MSEKTPFFSVVIPVYNSEKYLNECLESVFAQTFTDFELVLVDDESKDSSGTICEDWKNRFPDRVKVIHQKNAGVYIAKRNGIKASEGKFLYVMDNDDLIVSKDAFEMLHNEIISNGCDLVVFNATTDMEKEHLLCNIPYQDHEIFEKEKLQVLYEDFLKTKNLHHIWMMVFSRDLFDWDFEYTESFRMLRDGPSLVLPILSHATKVMYLNKTVYYWRIQNQNSASKHYDVVNFFNGIRFLHQRVMEYASGWKYKSDKTETLVKSSYVLDISIAAIKARSISQDASMSRKEYLKMLATDPLFRQEYTLKNLGFFRKIVASALYHKQYWLVNLVSSIVGKIKGR